MVDKKFHYRWDFIGLSTDEKPLPEDNEKVVNGSTYYCSDTSKLYVFYKDQWYERKPLGGGGGGGTDDYNDLSNLPSINGVELKGNKTTEDLNINIPDVSNFATKTELNTGLDNKADKATTYTKTEVDTELAEKQDTLVSGTNIKTVGGKSLLGSGNISVPTVETSVEWGGFGATVADYSQGQVSVDFFVGDNGTADIDIYTSDGVRKTTLQPFSNYEVCVDNVGGNVIQIGTIQEGSNSYGLYQFYYRTGDLPAANSAIAYSASNLLANYTIESFIDATGITSNGIFIGNGRTDNDNRLIVQQFSKVNKTITIRTYKDFTAETALLKVIFIGNKN